MKKIFNFIKASLLVMWELIKSFFITPKGFISLLIAFLITVGWALVFVFIGIIYQIPWFLTVGSSVIIFWAFFPASPMWGTIIILAYIIQRFILKDKKIMTWQEIKKIFKKSIDKNFQSGIM